MDIKTHLKVRPMYIVKVVALALVIAAGICGVAVFRLVHALAPCTATYGITAAGIWLVAAIVFMCRRRVRRPRIMVAAAVLLGLVSVYPMWSARMNYLIEFATWQMKGWRPLDARREAAQQPFCGIWICAHANLPFGHAYVFWLREYPDGSRQFDDVYGIHPNSRWLALFGRADAVIRKETGPEELTFLPSVASILVQVDAVTYTETLEKARKSAGTNGEYHLVRHDCVSFIEDIVSMMAKRTNITPVPRTLGSYTPAAYLDKLIESNPYWEVSPPAAK